MVQEAMVAAEALLGASVVVTQAVAEAAQVVPLVEDLSAAATAEERVAVLVTVVAEMAAMVMAVVVLEAAATAMAGAVMVPVAVVMAKAEVEKDAVSWGGEGTVVVQAAAAV